MSALERPEAPPLPPSPARPVLPPTDLEPAIARALARIGSGRPDLTRGVDVTMNPRLPDDTYAQVAYEQPRAVEVNPALAPVLGSDLQAEALMRHELDHVARLRMLHKMFGPDFKPRSDVMEASADNAAGQYIDAELARTPSRVHEAVPVNQIGVDWRWHAYPYGRHRSQLSAALLAQLGSKGQK